MWLILAIISMGAYALADLFGKKCVDSGTSETTPELLVSMECVAFFVGIVLFSSGLGESGKAPWQLLLEQPLMLIGLVNMLLYWALYLLSMRYVGLSFEEAVSGSTGVFYFAGLLAVNLITGKLSDMGAMLHPMRLIPILIVLAGTCLMPNVEVLACKVHRVPATKEKKERKRMLLGMALLLAALLIDAVDSMIATVIFDSGDIGTVDYFMASYFAALLPIVAFSVYLRIKKGTWYVPFRNFNKRKIGYVAATFSSSVLYVIASAADPVRTGILFIAYPLVPIIAAKVFLKERYSWRQNVCIWGIALAAVVFCVADYVL